MSSNEDKLIKEGKSVTSTDDWTSTEPAVQSPEQAKPIWLMEIYLNGWQQNTDKQHYFPTAFFPFEDYKTIENHILRFLDLNAQAITFSHIPQAPD